MAHRALSVIAALLLSGCGADGDGLSGPCYHEYREPIVTLTSSEASRVYISHVRIDGRQQRPNDLVGGFHSEATTPVIEGRTIICSVPCGFGTQPGNWKFRVALPCRGYLDSRTNAGTPHSTEGARHSTTAAQSSTSTREPV